MRSSFVLALSVLVFGCAFLVGCSSDPFKQWNAEARYENYVPRDAVVLGQGTGKFTFTTPAKGTAYLLDTSDMVKVQEIMTPKVITSGLLPKGTEVTFDPEAKRIYAKGQEGVGLRNIDPTHHFEVRFKAAD